MPRRHAPPARLTTARALQDHPALASLLPSLAPRALTRLFAAVGTHDAGALMALTPPELLARALDEAIWDDHGDAPRLDADVFIEWLEVWVNEGDAFTAERLAALDEDTLAVCLGEALDVQDSHATAFCRAPDDGESGPSDPGLFEPGADTELFGRFLVRAAQEDDWDVLHPALVALWDHEPERLLAMLERLTAGDSRLDGEAPTPLREDAAAAREHVRERAGFVSAAAARAFLAQSRTLSAEALVSMSEYDLETERHLRRLESTRRIEASPAHASEPDSGEPPGVGSPSGTVVATDRPVPVQGALDPGLWRLLIDAGVVDADTDPAVGRPAGLLAGPSGSASTLDRHLDALAASAPERLADAAAELAYLANVVAAAVDLPLAGRREAEARELAAATANLGIELLERHGVHVRPGQPPGLVQAFLLAWHALAELPAHVVQAFEVAMRAPETRRSLARRQWLRGQTAESMNDLSVAVRTGRHEAAREAVGLLSLAFVTDACRATAHLLGDPPRFPGLLEGGDKEAGRWFRSVTDLERTATLLRGLRLKH